MQLDAQRQKEEEAAKTKNATAAAPTDKSERGLEGLEEEAGQQGAFNPETGEINWDCPCLGGMADGPCGDEFKAAFSCFVFSEEEPKGMDCIDKFKYVWKMCGGCLDMERANETAGICRIASVNTPKSTGRNSNPTLVMVRTTI